MSRTMVFEELRCRHGARVLSEIPRLALSAGHAIVITGANGVGKTCLLYTSDAADEHRDV